MALPRYLLSRALGVTSIIMALVIMHLIFLSPSIRLRHILLPREFRGTSVPAQANDASSATRSLDFLMEEFKKCSSEIELRLGFESRWYEIKFLFLGGILLGFISLIVKELWAPGERAIATVFSSSAMLLASALGVVVSLAIDMHLRANRQVINFMGIWIAEYVEPRFLGPKINLPLGQTSVYGWETFLRASVPVKSGIVPAGYHSDLFYSLSFWPYVFLISVMAYAVYLSVHIFSCWTRTAPAACWLRRVTFIGVHFVIAFCAATTHIVPRMFEVRVWDPMTAIRGSWLSSDWVGDRWLVFWLYLVGAGLCFAFASLGREGLKVRPGSLDYLVVVDGDDKGQHQHEPS